MAKRRSRGDPKLPVEQLVILGESGGNSFVEVFDLVLQDGDFRISSYFAFSTQLLMNPRASKPL